MSPRHAGRSKRSPWRPLAAAAVGASVLLIAGNGVWATLNASATGTTSVNSGTLTLGLAGTGVGLTAAISNMAPGDTVNRHIALTNGGSLATSGMTLGLATNNPSSGLVSEIKGLQITVNACSVAWTATAGTCSGTRTTALSARSVNSLLTAPATLANAATGVGDKTYLQISLRLPDHDDISVNGVSPPGSIQGQTVSLTYTFTATQRAGTTTNS